MVWKLLEELHFHAFDVRKQKIGQAAGAQAEPLVVEPFFAKHLFDDSVVATSGFNSSTSATASLGVLFIFQFPAIIFFLAIVLISLNFIFRTRVKCNNTGFF